VAKYHTFEPETHRLKGGEFVFGLEKTADLVEEARPLNEDHWNEVEAVPTAREFNPDYEMFRRYEKADSFFVFTARTPTFGLVGYMGFYFQKWPQAPDATVASEAGMFVAKKFRGTGVADTLLDYAGRHVGKLGATVMTITSRHFSGGVDLTEWLTGRGFEPMSVTFSKEVQNVR
jgi:GNAT superfamily N-acetyltransferase